MTPIWHKNRETGRKVKTRIGLVMRWAIAHGYRSDDPAGPALTAALPRHQRNPPGHFASLPYGEVAAALARLDSSAKTLRPTVACLWFIAATVARTGEARLCTWDEIDLDNRVWTVPGPRTKTSRPHVVPLSPVALTALDEARGYSGGYGLVFVSPTGRILSNGTLSRFTGTEGFTPHGLRASFRTWCAEIGVPREVAEAASAHSASLVERAYQRSDLLTARREIMDAWAKVLVTPHPAPT